MTVLNKMSSEAIEERLKEDSSFGMIDDATASNIIARDSVNALEYRKKMIQYFQDKEKFGPWMPKTEN